MKSKLLKLNMTISTKNMVQEIYQKLKLPLPVYNTQAFTTGSSPWPLFVSEIKTSDEKYAKGTPANSKKKAELNAAREWLLNHTEWDPETESYQVERVYYDSSEINTIAFIDVENMPNAINSVIKFPVRTVGFVGRLHHLAGKTTNCEEIKKYDEFYVANTVSKDGADIWMAMHIAEHFTDIKKYQNVIIITRDHFGTPVSEYLKNTTTATATIRVLVAVNEREVCDTLQKLNQIKTCNM